ncbi:MAG TPA: hypothetical protein VFS76_16350 [Pyrinomonadaceae bacterium]|nr:hypothetical protein [Pyrinomonadaceae bacterium]
MRITKLKFMLVALVGLASLAVFISSGTSQAAPLLEDRINAHWRGTESFSVTGAGPNVARCGAFPENIELSFAGSGIDTQGGAFNVVASACTNTVTNLIFDLKATDTYVQSGDQVFIEADSFVQVINPENCVASNSHAVMGRVAGGTGGHAGASGHARFHFANNITPCNGQNAPAHVWFEGVVMLP